MNIREKIVELMSSKDYKPMLREELLAYFDIGMEFRKEFYKILNSLEKEGLIVKVGKERYRSVDNQYLIVGRLEGHERGFGFLIPNDNTREDVFIPIESMDGAMDGDRVVVNVLKRSGGRKSEEGEVIRILKRANTSIVGVFEDNKNFGFLIPDDKRIYYDIFIPKSSTNGAKDGQKIVVDI